MGKRTRRRLNRAMAAALKSTTYMSDRKAHGKRDDWSFPKRIWGYVKKWKRWTWITVGDCEDIALECLSIYAGGDDLAIEMLRTGEAHLWMMEVAQPGKHKGGWNHLGVEVDGWHIEIVYRKAARNPDKKWPKIKLRGRVPPHHTLKKMGIPVSDTVDR